MSMESKVGARFGALVSTSNFQLPWPNTSSKSGAINQGSKKHDESIGIIRISCMLFAVLDLLGCGAEDVDRARSDIGESRSLGEGLRAVAFPFLKRCQRVDIKEELDGAALTDDVV